MRKQQDKWHWYDGKLYSYLIDPCTEDVRKIISDLIEYNSNVIDIGCGTGSLAFYLSNKCEYVLGIELSKRMIDYANSIKIQNSVFNVDFLYGDAIKMSSLTEKNFDYAIFSLSLHEIESNSRVKSLEEAKKITNKIIIYDYLAEEKTSIRGLINSIIEFIAGKEHYINYKSFVREKGIFGLLEKNGFNVEKFIIDKKIYGVVKANVNRLKSNDI